MADNTAQEKTEKPTPRRRSKAREKGQVAKSQELGSIGVLFAGLMCLYAFGGFVYDQSATMMTHILSRAAETPVSLAQVHNLSIDLMGHFLRTLAPFMLAVVLAGVAVNVAQTGFMLATSRLRPDLKKINPLEGLKKFVSMRMLVEAIKNTGKICVVGLVAYLVLADELPNFPNIGKLGGLTAMLIYIADVCLRIFLWSLAAMFILAILDYAYQKYQFEKGLKMSKQEIKDEFKQTEGDPHVKSRIRQLQRERAMKRMMAAVPQADVVITNPTHLAVAIFYQAGQMDAPEVVAKGQNKIAERIKALAQENNVPIIEDKPLAQALYKSVEVGQRIPFELFGAVAAILAHVYREKQTHQQVLDAIKQ
ncbi:flagellar biosynthetic protein FlhB [Desulfarculus baarsii DSM 2075]|uniref:Flagellar biosynthetic protein FlhB n=1 Tax=Desulfarculus baarsii (strain ATCC 33931 / DSM 2075 / LMG 7858 / VKM B-1802 / 2st14) TaxID=644282 RepID=E1QJD7_DESB2|nr:flagellar biosynthesis protein FlhB [Desulfarculus baarsii]ADK85680.1 flagellar biosynthetic protein FlhB [Desulfarculus baarsii DSM 2075]